MAVRFVIGRAGAGKTRWCFDRIVSALKARPLGPPIYWILPKQATFQAERELSCGHGLAGYFRARLLSFDDLGREVIDECGGTAAPAVTDLGRRMILGHLLRQLQPRLHFFKDVAHQPGVAVELDTTFSELERCGQDVADLCGKLADDAGAPALAAKLHDLQLIYSAYSQFLGQDRLDPQRRLNEALASIERCSSLREADVYVDGFYDFTDYERRVLAGLGKLCRSVSITLLLDPSSRGISDPHQLPDEMNLFHKTHQAYRRLWFVFEQENVPRLQPETLTDAKRFQAPALQAVEAWDAPHAPAPIAAKRAGLNQKRIPENDDQASLFSSKPTPFIKVAEPAAADSTGITLVEAPDRRSEVDAVAREIRRLASTGARYRDMAVLMRSSEDYDELIDASFREHNIPFFIDRRRTAAHHPLLQFVRAALQVARNNFPHEHVMTLIKSGLLGLNLHEADELENYVLQHGIRHGTWLSPSPWTGRRRRGDEDAQTIEPVPDLPRIEQLRRRVTGKLEPFVRAIKSTPASTVRDISSAMFKLLESCNARAVVVQWMNQAEASGRLTQQGEHQRVWAELIKLFDELVELLGGEAVTLDSFQSILDSGLESFDLALIPPTLDQVLVGPVDRTRTPPLKICFVLGLNEGQFPRSARESTVFSDADRRSLRQRDVDLDPDTQRRLLDEQLLGYIAFTRASEHLYLTRSASDDGGKLQSPSPLWRRMIQRFPETTIQQGPRQDRLPLEMIATPRQLITSLMRWVRGNTSPTPRPKDSWAAVYQWLATHEACDDAIDVMRFRAWKALSYHNEASLSPEFARQLFSGPLRVHSSQLEAFGSCPFQHFARYALGLKDREHRAVGGADLSRVYHDVLEKLVRELLGDNQDWTQLNDRQTADLLDRLTTQVGERLRGELMLGTARNRYLLAHIRQTLQSVVAAQRAVAMRGKFRPAWVNVRFGEEETDPSSLPALVVRTPAGNHCHIRGKIDRVDLRGKSADAMAIDYKLGVTSLNFTQIKHGISLQLLVFLLLLEQHGEKLAGTRINPSAAFYVQLLRYIRDQDPADALSPDDPNFHLMIKPRGIFDRRQLDQLDDQMTHGASDVVSAFLKKDNDLGNRNSTDAAEQNELAGILELVRQNIGRAADQILSGEIGLKPYRIGKVTPCPQCEFRDVCRFDPAQTPYVQLQGLRREQVLQEAIETARNADR